LLLLICARHNVVGEKFQSIEVIQPIASVEISLPPPSSVQDMVTGVLMSDYAVLKWPFRYLRTSTPQHRMVMVMQVPVRRASKEILPPYLCLDGPRVGIHQTKII
jgi:hypothetical protein